MPLVTKPVSKLRLLSTLPQPELFDAKKKQYVLGRKGGKEQALSIEKMVDMLVDWAKKYPICSIEDGCSEDDWEGWKLLTRKARRQGSNRWRRSLRHEHQTFADGYRQGNRQQHSGQSETKSAR